MPPKKLRKIGEDAVADYIRKDVPMSDGAVQLPAHLAVQLSQRMQNNQPLTVDNYVFLDNLGSSEIDLSEKTLNIADLIKLGRMKNVKSVLFRNKEASTDSSDSVLLFIRLIEPPSHLVALDLSFLIVTDENRQNVTKVIHMFPNLEKLVLYQVCLKEINLSFEKLLNLRHLNLSMSEIGRITGISKASGLQKLYLNELELSDEDWSETLKLTNLVALSIVPLEKDEKFYMINLFKMVSEKAATQGVPGPWKELCLLNVGRGFEQLDLKAKGHVLSYVLQAHPKLVTFVAIGANSSHCVMKAFSIVYQREISLVTDENIFGIIKALSYHSTGIESTVIDHLLEKLLEKIERKRGDEDFNELPEAILSIMHNRTIPESTLEKAVTVMEALSSSLNHRFEHFNEGTLTFFGFKLLLILEEQSIETGEHVITTAWEMITILQEELIQIFGIHKIISTFLMTIKRCNLENDRIGAGAGRDDTAADRVEAQLLTQLPNFQQWIPSVCQHETYKELVQLFVDKIELYRNGNWENKEFNIIFMFLILRHFLADDEALEWFQHRGYFLRIVKLLKTGPDFETGILEIIDKMCQRDLLDIPLFLETDGIYKILLLREGRRSQDMEDFLERIIRSLARSIPWRLWLSRLRLRLAEPQEELSQSRASICDELLDVAMNLVKNSVEKSVVLESLFVIRTLIEHENAQRARLQSSTTKYFIERILLQNQNQFRSLPELYDGMGRISGEILALLN